MSQIQLFFRRTLHLPGNTPGLIPELLLPAFVSNTSINTESKYKNSPHNSCCEGFLFYLLPSSYKGNLKYSIVVAGYRFFWIVFLLWWPILDV
jgi:hypothetical protein